MDEALIVKFMQKVDAKGPDECWNWLGYLSNGCGEIVVNKVHMRSSRIAYELAYGKFDSSLCVCHKCDNPMCCNPGHLFLGTRGDNIRDAVSKKRHKSGRLTVTQVSEIRRRYFANPKPRQRDLAAEFGVSVSQISGILHGRFWKGIGEIVEEYKSWDQT